MALVRTAYQLHFEDIAAGEPRLGSASLVPWDSETFEFPVASYQTGASDLDDGEQQAFGLHFSSWMKARRVALCSCSLPAENRSWRKLLEQAGFHFVDLTLKPSLGGLATARLPESRCPVRLATPLDRFAIGEIAAGSFAHGRYHADPFFPQTLANLRYRIWMDRALTDPNPEDRVFVLERAGKVEGFFHVTVEGSLSHLRLVAVAPGVKSSVVGVELCVGTLRELQSLGVRGAVTSISASNTSALNLYASLGFRFSQPELVYHWHHGL